MLEPGMLWTRVRAATAHALHRGALQRIPTACEVVEERGVGFLVHVSTQVERKERASDLAERTARNPFLPYDEDLFVADLTPTHVCLLNKFPVVEPHLLVVTRAFEEQEAPLGRADFEALALCLREIDGLGFYNAGAPAGASQRHKHLQLVPLPLGPGRDRVPSERLLIAGELPFEHAWARLESAGAAQLHATQLQLLDALGLDPAAPGPMNLLATREWLLVVPRTREHFGSISVNALGFAGSFYVRDRAELALLRERGPLEVLRGVTRPHST
ncbi:MAG TPA: phosphorylase [Myxococcota bacterium]|nr:phosphorylase [Myxococcota bacterium]